MTESNAKAPEGMHTITPHIVVNDAAKAAAWYKEVLGAEERSRIELPGGNLMQVELWFGDSAVMLADEFPELGVLSPLSVGGTSTVLHLPGDCRRRSRDVRLAPLSRVCISKSARLT
jgi:uncharacterized glyoxalase superfamily protein PhnB